MTSRPVLPASWRGARVPRRRRPHQRSHRLRPQTSSPHTRQLGPPGGPRDATRALKQLGGSGHQGALGTPRVPYHGRLPVRPYYLVSMALPLFAAFRQIRPDASCDANDVVQQPPNQSLPAKRSYHWQTFRLIPGAFIVQHDCGAVCVTCLAAHKDGGTRAPQSTPQETGMLTRSTTQGHKKCVIVGCTWLHHTRLQRPCAQPPSRTGPRSQAAQVACMRQAEAGDQLPNLLDAPLTNLHARCGMCYSRSHTLIISNVH